MSRLYALCILAFVTCYANAGIGFAASCASLRTLHDSTPKIQVDRVRISHDRSAPSGFQIDAVFLLVNTSDPFLEFSGVYLGSIYASRDNNHAHGWAFHTAADIGTDLLSQMADSLGNFSGPLGLAALGASRRRRESGPVSAVAPRSAHF